MPAYTNVTLTVHGITATVPSTASAILKSDNMNDGRKVNGDIYPPGFVRGTCPEHHQRGHLIGKALGGDGGDKNNLVTLTDGTNHPIMYEYEHLVHQYVKSHPNIDFYYIVSAKYDANNYHLTTLGNYGAMHNPYCPFPCPESLTIEFYYIDNNGHRSYPISIPANNAVFGTQTLIIPNGVYKFHEGHVVHVANGCWAA
ncbi:DNA/RNA non-specific endonuclease [Enterobacter sp. RIT418]|uniref:DNA/RNA non-specific endonuclease n=1 Tax=Enterobacter sp. RIT418 TaxID=2202164 RepID=UPI000D47B520|nr:DNA/RNA non-specific endonuclease [Enterobacter sp. RIT 418]RAU37565.1 hypothetical protein DBY73_006785 [Enterobacter sp. RIT 418]